MAANYLVRATQDVVETWSVARMPFEPKGWMREWRDALKSALRGVDVPNGFLAGRYESASVAACDTENVLFYNLGGVFGASTRHGLRFERLFGTAPSPEPLTTDAMHYHNYSVARPGEPFTCWTEANQLAAFANVTVPAVGASSNPALIWLPVRQALTRSSAASHQGRLFALRLRLEGPPVTGAAASLVKSLFDGVIAAFSAHDGSREDEVVLWLNDRFAYDMTLSRKLLQSLEGDPLGTRRLLHPRAQGFQWAPDDDRCVAGELVITRSNQSRFRLSGELFAVEPRPAS